MNTMIAREPIGVNSTASKAVCAADSASAMSEVIRNSANTTAKHNVDVVMDTFAQLVTECFRIIVRYVTRRVQTPDFQRLGYGQIALSRLGLSCWGTHGKNSGKSGLYSGKREFNSDSTGDLPTPTAKPGLELKLLMYREFCLAEQSEEEASAIAAIGTQLRCLREKHSYSRLELANLLSVDVELLIAVENGFGNLKTAQWLLQLVQGMQNR
jgi:hypothetical protein